MLARRCFTGCSSSNQEAVISAEMKGMKVRMERKMGKINGYNLTRIVSINIITETEPTNWEPPDLGGITDLRC